MVAAAVEAAGAAAAGRPIRPLVRLLARTHHPHVGEGLIDREEIDALMWNVVDTLAMVRDIHLVLFGADDEEEEEGDA